MGGISFNVKASTSSLPETHLRTHKFLVICNYILLASASSFIFLTLSLRLFPSLCGFFLILLHVFTIIIAVSACSVAVSGSSRWYATHMVVTVITAIFQGSCSVLIFVSTADFLGFLKSYVREENGVVILRMAGVLSVLIFFLEWLVLILAFKLRYHAFLHGDVNGNGGGLRAQDENQKNWPWMFQA